MDRIFEVKNLYKQFGGLIVTNNVSFELQKGEILGIIGPNGAGKSTLFNLLSGALMPDKGKVFFKGEDVTGKKDFELCKMGVSRTFQIVKPFKELTVLENVLVGSYLRHKNKQEAIDQALDVLEKMKLADKKDTLAKNLNLAEQKRLEMTRALATDPDILMLDEVLAGLNTTEVSEMLPIIESIVEDNNRSIIIIEHVLYALMNLSHCVIVINEGKIIKQGTPNEVVNDPEVIRIYLGEEYDFVGGGN